MKPLPMNISSMKKIAGDKNSSTFLHKDGHEIKVAHAPLSALQRKQLERLPLAEGGLLPAHMHGKDQPNRNPKLEQSKVRNYPPAGQIETLRKLAHGGELEQEATNFFNNPPSTPTPTPTPEETLDEKYARIRQQNAQNASGNIKQYADGTPDQPIAQDDSAPTAPISPIDTMANAPAQAQVGRTPPSPGLMFNNGTLNAPQAAGLEQRGAGEQQQVNAAQAQAMVPIEQARAQAQAELGKKVQDNFNNFSQHTDAAAQAIQQGLINPNHYMESMGTGKKVSTALGLFMGGFGAGAHGGNNPAMDFLNKQIDRDIDAQKARSKQQETIYGMYHDVYGASNTTNNLTKATMDDIYATKAKQIAAQLGTPAAKAAADLFISQKMQEKNQLLLDASQNAAIETAKPNQKTQQPGQSNLSPKEQEAMDAFRKNTGQPETSENSYADTPILNPGAQSHLNSLRYTPKAKEEIDQIKTQYTQAQQADQLLNQLHAVHQQMAQQAKQGGGPGYIRRHDPVSDIPLGIGPFINKALVQPITATPTNKAYDTNKTRIVGDIANALKGTNIGGEEIQKIVNDNSPEPNDPPELVQQKERNIRLFIKNSVNKSLLKDWGLSK